MFTGTDGILQYPDVSSNKRDIFLYEDQYLPAPLYFWKVLRDQETNTAAVFIGLNDPHSRRAPVELCPNTCSEMSWVDWEMTDLDGGYMYCCTLKEAAAAFPVIASLGLESSGLLQGNNPPSPTTTPEPPADQCQINLDGTTGRYPPIILQNDRFVFPKSAEEDGTRYLKFGEIISS